MGERASEIVNMIDRNQAFIQLPEGIRDTVESIDVLPSGYIPEDENNFHFDGDVGIRINNKDGSVYLLGLNVNTDANNLEITQLAAKNSNNDCWISSMVELAIEVAKLFHIGRVSMKVEVLNIHLGPQSQNVVTDTIRPFMFEVVDGKEVFIKHIRYQMNME